ncbi:hypothetical protein L486_03774 [Kwoniella mangroviensis CBS 10435]|uniref:Uncharacterized protein n=1 Tax=Kwoniella mangroviensis CBS 10435 TaxID=1331196 RepID=A0A1B9IUQ8_9TREE|nr:hypothetical protein L486_03774 [Kwoniella mangroviensis CBS 10435]
MSQDLQVNLSNGETHTISKVFYYAKPTSDTIQFFSAVHRGSCQETTNAGLTLAAQVEKKITESGRYAPHEESAKYFAKQMISTSLDQLIEMSQNVRAPVLVLAADPSEVEESMDTIRDAGVYVSPASEVSEEKLREMDDFAQELKKPEHIWICSATQAATEVYPGMNIVSMDWENFKELERHGLITQSSKEQSLKDRLRSWKLPLVVAATAAVLRP